MTVATEPHIKRTIRRQQLREIVLLADSTIYEMEQGGELPRRFALSPRSVVWDLAEVEGWLRADQPQLSEHSLLTSGNGGRARSRSVTL
jgi:prophage regulatory protein